MRPERAPAHQPARADAEHSFAYVIGLLERLGDVLADPWVDCHAKGSEFESAVCGMISYLHATGASTHEVAARLTHLVQSAAPRHRPTQETAARVAAIVSWCDRADAGRQQARSA